MSTPVRTAILVSGRGSNMENIIHASRSGMLKERINPIIVISNNFKAEALEKALSLGVRATCIDHKVFKSRYLHEKEIVHVLRKNNIELVILAGYMRVLGDYDLPDSLLNSFYKRIINIHPSLLPAFPGMDAQAQALDYGVKVTGCTVHFVDSGVDTGKIIRQEAIEIYDNDTVESLSKRLLGVEHQLMLESLRELYMKGYFEARRKEFWYEYDNR